MSNIVKEFSFFSGIYFEDTFYINLYECQMNLTVITDDVRQQKVALDRIGYIINDCVQNSIIISEEKNEIIEKYDNAGLRLCIVPEEPFDQIFGYVLLNKFNAIMEDRLEVNNMIFGSRLSDYIKFDLAKEEAETLFSGKAWYNKSDTNIRNLYKNKKEKIVKLHVQTNDWNEYGLGWEETN